MDYLRLIWIVDYSGPRGAAWPRVSISEPLAFTSTSSLLLPLPRSQPALPNLSASTHTLPSPSTDLFVLPANPLRVAHHPSRGSFSQKFVCSDVARPAADYMPFRNPMLRESRVSGQFPVFLTIQNLRNFLAEPLPTISLFHDFFGIFERLFQLTFRVCHFNI